MYTAIIGLMLLKHLKSGCGGGGHLKMKVDRPTSLKFNVPIYDENERHSV